MASTRVGGKNGAVTWAGTLMGAGIDFASWTLRLTHPVDDDTSYADTGLGSSHAGSGTYDYNLSASGFLVKGAATSPPLIANGTSNVYSGAVTLKADTGCTEAGTFVITGVNFDHRKRAGATPASVDGVNDGDVTETWATT